MVGGAILAASPHNIQPWIFEVSGKRIGLYTDPARRTGVLDPLGREHLVGLGCALENRRGHGTSAATGHDGARARPAGHSPRGNPL